jgi:hypothetical protein
VVGWVGGRRRDDVCVVCKPSAPAYRTALPLIRHDCIDYAGIALAENVRAPRFGSTCAFLRHLRQALAVGFFNQPVQSTALGLWILDAEYWVPSATQRPATLWSATPSSILPVCIRTLAMCAGDKTGEFTVGLCNPGAYRSIKANHVSGAPSEVRPTHGKGRPGPVSFAGVCGMSKGGG